MWQAERGADGRRHLPEESSLSRRYSNLDVSILNAEGLGVVAGPEGTRLGHEGGLAPLGRGAPEGQCTMHGTIVFSLDFAPTPTELQALADHVAAAAATLGAGVRYTDAAQWERVCSDNGAGLIATIDARRKRERRL